MCSYFGSLPDYRGGAVIAALEPGDEITIKKGFGHPPAGGNVVEIIASVDGMSALTISGRILACGDGHGIKATGRHFEEDVYVLSPEAQRLIAEASS